MDRSQPIDLTAELDFAELTVQEAGRLLMRTRRDGVHANGVQRKSGNDIVTEADLRSERLILDALRAAYPGDAVLAEESGAADGGSGRRWSVDPLDGTVNFANGVPCFAVTMALEEQDRGLVGVVFDPNRDELFSARLDGRATGNGRAIEAENRAERLSDAVAVLALPDELWAAPGAAARWMGACRGVRLTGSTALELAWTAAGRYDLCVYRRTPARWDWTAGELLIERVEGCAVRTLGSFGGLDVVAAGSGELVRELDPAFFLPQ